jgi:hypothetical protein
MIAYIARVKEALIYKVLQDHTFLSLRLIVVVLILTICFIFINVLCAELRIVPLVYKLMK